MEDKKHYTPLELTQEIGRALRKALEAGKEPSDVLMKKSESNEVEMDKKDYTAEEVTKIIGKALRKSLEDFTLKQGERKPAKTTPPKGDPFEALEYHAFRSAKAHHDGSPFVAAKHMEMAKAYGAVTGVDDTAILETAYEVVEEHGKSMLSKHEPEFKSHPLDAFLFEYIDAIETGEICKKEKAPSMPSVDIPSGDPVDSKHVGKTPDDEKSKPIFPKEKVQVKGDKAKLATADIRPEVKKEEVPAAVKAPKSLKVAKQRAQGAKQDWEAEQKMKYGKAEHEESPEKSVDELVDEILGERYEVQEILEGLPEKKKSAVLAALRAKKKGQGAEKAASKPLKKKKTPQVPALEGMSPLGMRDKSKEEKPAEKAEPLAKPKWNWQEPTAGHDDKGVARKDSGYAHSNDAGRYHTAKLVPAKGGHVVQHSSVAGKDTDFPGGGDSKVHYESKPFKTPEEGMAHLKQYIGGK